MAKKIPHENSGGYYSFYLATNFTNCTNYLVLISEISGFNYMQTSQQAARH
ncbi:MAG: hypothetical protein WCH21_08935 [Bacteroidota bacterium]|jgi:hypothetical protein